MMLYYHLSSLVFMQHCYLCKVSVLYFLCLYCSVLWCLIFNRSSLFICDWYNYTIVSLYYCVIKRPSFHTTFYFLHCNHVWQLDSITCGYSVGYIIYANHSNVHQSPVHCHTCFILLFEEKTFNFSIYFILILK